MAKLKHHNRKAAGLVECDRRMNAYGSLATLVAGECCNGQRVTTYPPHIQPVEARGAKHFTKLASQCRGRSTIRCLATGTECDMLKCHPNGRAWRSPMGAAPGKEQPKETSGLGRCTWFEAALLPLLPEHLLHEIQEQRRERRREENERRRAERAARASAAPDRHRAARTQRIRTGGPTRHKHV